MTAARAQFRDYWRRLSRPDVGALVLVIVAIIILAMGGSGGGYSFLKYMGIVSAVYLLFRFIGWWRSRLLWSLRNRLIVAYLFIALVPVVLVVVLAFLSGMLLYQQLGGYLLYQDLQRRVQMVADGSRHVASALESVSPNVAEADAEKIVSAQEHAVYDGELPGLEIEFSDNRATLERLTKQSQKHFAGFVENDHKLFVMGLHEVKSAKGPRVVEIRVPITAAFASTIAPDFGQVSFHLLEPSATAAGAPQEDAVAGRGFKTTGNIPIHRRNPAPARGFWDREVTGVTRFDAVSLKAEPGGSSIRPVLASFSTRPSQLNERMFSSVGDFGRLYVYGLGVVAVGFFLLEIAALVTGIVLTRHITSAVAGLYNATQYVQAGDFTHRVRIESRDQLGVLGESFNLMTGSISGLIEEQKQRQRLENEISIAREVQNQLFPQKLPSVPGVRIEAICKAARMVSGDYYDFIQLSPTHLAIAVADISGKGISAALLMASLQAALRSQLLAPGSDSLSTAELVARLNTHLVRNTADDRFATFFIAVYDSATRQLRYTNAGHLPSFCLCADNAMNLDKGGIVLGVVDDYPYEEGRITVPAGATLVGYSDGLVEPENVYGEEFGIQRLRDAAVQVQSAPPRVIADRLMQAAEEWAGTPEQADDMTVIVARLE